jgi:hypothetical protein
MPSRTTFATLAGVICSSRPIGPALFVTSRAGRRGVVSGRAPLTRASQQR